MAFTLYDAMRNPTSEIYERTVARVRDFTGRRVVIHYNMARTVGGEVSASGGRYQRRVEMDLPDDPAMAVAAIFGPGSPYLVALKAGLKVDSDRGLLTTSVTIQLA